MTAIRSGATVAGLLLALGIQAMTVGLIGLAAAVVGWLLAGREPSVLARQRLE